MKTNKTKKISNHNNKRKRNLFSESFLFFLLSMSTYGTLSVTVTNSNYFLQTDNSLGQTESTNSWSEVSNTQQDSTDSIFGFSQVSNTEIIDCFVIN